jgi:hypothetical protein
MPIMTKDFILPRLEMHLFFPKLHSGASYVSFTVVDMAKCVVIDIFPNRQPERVLQ